MAKLDMQSKPGFNSGMNYFAKSMKISDIAIDPEISQIFKIQEKIRHTIFEKIKSFGFDKSQPLTIQKGTNILLDGHTRLKAAKEAGLEEVPVVEMDFNDRDAAVMYTFERQAMRRNLTGAEILVAISMIPEERNKKGAGRAAKQLADKLGIGETTVYDSRTILKEAPPEILEKVQSGEMSIKKGAAATKLLRNTGKQGQSQSGAVVKKEDKSALRNTRINELSSNVLTAHAKIGDALNYITDSKCTDLLGEAMDCLKTAENRLASLA